MAKTLISGTSCEMFHKGLKSSKTSEEGQVIEDALGTVQSNFPLRKKYILPFVTSLDQFRLHLWL